MYIIKQDLQKHAFFFYKIFISKEINFEWRNFIWHNSPMHNRTLSKIGKHTYTLPEHRLSTTKITAKHGLEFAKHNYLCNICVDCRFLSLFRLKKQRF